MRVPALSSASTSSTKIRNSSNGLTLPTMRSSSPYFLLLKWKPPRRPSSSRSATTYSMLTSLAWCPRSTRTSADGEGRSPVREVGVVEGRFVGLVLQEHPHPLWHGGVHLAEALDHPVAAVREGILARVVGAVGEP